MIDQWSKDASDGVFASKKTLSFPYEIGKPIKAFYMLSDADAGEVWQSIWTFIS